MVIELLCVQHGQIFFSRFSFLLPVIAAPLILISPKITLEIHSWHSEFLPPFCYSNVTHDIRASHTCWPLAPSFYSDVFPRSGLSGVVVQSSSFCMGCQGITCCLCSHPVYSCPLLPFHTSPDFGIKEKLLSTLQTRWETWAILRCLFPSGCMRSLTEVLCRNGAVTLVNHLRLPFWWHERLSVIISDLQKNKTKIICQSHKLICIEPHSQAVQPSCQLVACLWMCRSLCSLGPGGRLPGQQLEHRCWPRMADVSVLYFYRLHSAVSIKLWRIMFEMYYMIAPFLRIPVMEFSCL